MYIIIKQFLGKLNVMLNICFKKIPFWKEFIFLNEARFFMICQVSFESTVVQLGNLFHFNSIQ